jgi:hypothetical protein
MPYYEQKSLISFSVKIEMEFKITIWLVSQHSLPATDSYESCWSCDMQNFASSLSISSAVINRYGAQILMVLHTLVQKYDIAI